MINIRDNMTEDEIDFLIREIRRVCEGVLAQRAGIIPLRIDVLNPVNAVAMRRYVDAEMGNIEPWSSESTRSGTSSGSATAGSSYSVEFIGSDSSSHFSDALSDDSEWHSTVGEHHGWSTNEIHVERIPDVLQDIAMHCLADYSRWDDLDLELAWDSWASLNLDCHSPHSIGHDRPMHM